MKMKTLLGALLVVGFCLCDLAPAVATTTSGTVTSSNTYIPGRLNHMRVYTWSWTSDTGGNVISDDVRLSGPGEIVRVQIDPGITSPTASYDMVITDTDSFDVLTGLGANLSATVTLNTVPSITAASFEWPVYTYGRLTLTITNAGNAKSGVVKFYVKEL